MATTRLLLFGVGGRLGGTYTKLGTESQGERITRLACTGGWGGRFRAAAAFDKTPSTGSGEAQGLGRTIYADWPMLVTPGNIL